MRKIMMVLLLLGCNEPVEDRYYFADELPAFDRLSSRTDHKEAFFTFLLPLIHQQNKAILEDRARLVLLQQSSPSSQDSAWLFALADILNIKDDDDIIETLLLGHDTLPPSLVLAQAANESSWGTSRFAIEGNNLFGEWCFTPGCGIVPKLRKVGETHEVRKFTSINASIESYYRNINGHRAYRQLRELRAAARTEGRIATGYELAAGLSRYSQRRERYVQELRSIITFNALE